MTNIDLQYKIVSEEQDLSDYQNNSVISDRFFSYFLLPFFSSTEVIFFYSFYQMSFI